MYGLLGIDVGTSAVKSSLFTTKGVLLGTESFEYPTIYNDYGLVEQNPEDWWKGIVVTVNKLLEDNKINVVALAMSTQGGTLVPVDSDNNPTHPAIVWSDERCKTARSKILEKFTEDEIYEITGWRLSSGLNLLQILELKINNRSVFDKTVSFLSVPDYLAVKLTGKCVIDFSNAGINQLYDVRDNKWSKVLLDFAGISENQLAQLSDSGIVIGKIKREVIKELGISSDAVLVTGGHDQYCAALGAGLTNPGDVLIGSGTAWTVNLPTKLPKVDVNSGNTFSRHVIPGLYGTLISLSFGGQSLEWFRTLLLNNRKSDFSLSYKVIDENVGKRNIDRQLIFIPFFNGISHKINCPELSAGFLGIKSGHDAYDLIRAIMESVAMYAAYLITILSDNGIVNKVVLTGGAGNSDVWVKMVADTLNLPVIVPNNKNASSRGAAMLAGIGAGIFTNHQEAIDVFLNETNVKEKIIYPGKNHQLMFKKQKLFIEMLEHLTIFYK